MCNTAAHVVDRVLPAVPVRQWVLALPFELRRLAAFRAGVATAIGRIFIQQIAKAQKRRAGVPGAQHGALNFVQRFGGSLNLHLHFNAIVLEGVFAANRSGRQAFREIGAPSHEELEDIVQRIRERTLCWLRKCGLLDERPNDRALERSAGTECA